MISRLYLKKSFKVKVKLDYISKLSIHVNVTETPWGSIVNFSIPDLSYERRVDETLFGQTVASTSVEEKLDKMDSLVEGLKTSFDGLDQDEIEQIVDVQTKLKILTECPRCSSNVKKGWRCAYCKTLMVEFK